MSFDDIHVIDEDVFDLTSLLSSVIIHLTLHYIKRSLDRS